MEIQDIKKEAYNAHMLSVNRKTSTKYSLYFETNENLTELFKAIDVKGKDVLTVLASSDQALSCFHSKARTVDTFDRVYISLWYAYLRKWIILYQNKLYPSYHFLEDGDYELYNLVCKIVPTNKDEAEAQIFWREYMELNNNKSDLYLFNSNLCSQPKPFFDDIDSIKGFYNEPINFRYMDIFTPIDVNKKYDVLMLSNILEYASEESKFIIIKDNIEKLLRSDGIAICTTKIFQLNTDRHKDEVKVLTRDNLEASGEFKYYEELFGRKKDLAYVYKKKRY